MWHIEISRSIVPSNHLGLILGSWWIFPMFVVLITYLYWAWWDLHSDCRTTPVLRSLFSVSCCAVTVICCCCCLKLPLSYKHLHTQTHTLSCKMMAVIFHKMTLWFQKRLFHLKAEAENPAERFLHGHWLLDSDGDVILNLCLSPLLRPFVFILW